MIAKHRPGAQKRLVEKWEAVPEGTEVIVTKDDKSEVSTKTRSVPWLLGGHTAVIMLEGISGGYALERVRLAPTSPSTGTK